MGASGFDFYNQSVNSAGAGGNNDSVGMYPTGSNESFNSTGHAQAQQQQYYNNGNQQQQQFHHHMMTSSVGGNSRHSTHSSASSQSGHSNTVAAYNAGTSPSTSGYNSSCATTPVPPGGASVHSAGSGQGGNYPNFAPRAPIVASPVHAARLTGKAEYLEFPQQGAEITTAAQWKREHKVFIGHVKFELSADGLRWLVYMLTGVQAGKVEVRGMGCFMVFFGSADEVFRVRGLHKRVLFDTTGIWFAQDQDQEQALHHYAEHVAPSVHAKLPKGLMVVDEETSRRRSRNKGNKAAKPAATAAAASAAPKTQAAAGDASSTSAASAPSTDAFNDQAQQHYYNQQHQQQQQHFYQPYNNQPYNNSAAAGSAYHTQQLPAHQLWDNQQQW